MSDAVVGRIQELTRATRMLAIVGASLKLRSSDAADAAIRREVDHALTLALGADGAAALHHLEPAELLPMIEMAIVESRDIFLNAGQAAGWQVVDRAMLEAMGRSSSGAFDRILALAAGNAGLAASLTGRFLDVGTGVAGIALRAVEACPALHVEAIDIWGPALRLAEERVAASPHGERIDLYELDITELDPEPRFTLAWLPTMFLPRETVHRAIDRIANASVLGAWLVAGLYTMPPEPFPASMARLRTLRSGGEVVDPAALGEAMQAHGYADVATDVGPIATFVYGRRR